MWVPSLAVMTAAFVYGLYLDLPDISFGTLAVAATLGALVIGGLLLYSVLTSRARS